MSSSDSGSLTWVIALAVITVVVSCCVLYAIRQVFALTEKVNKSQAAVNQLEDMQTQIKVLQEAQTLQTKKATEKEIEEERIKKEKESHEEKNNSSHEKVVSRLENLEKGLVEHEAKVEDAVSRAFYAESSYAGSNRKKGGGGANGAGGNLSSKARKIMMLNKLKPSAQSHADMLRELGEDMDDNDDDDDNRGLLDMSVLEFAKIMNATTLSSSGNNNNNVSFAAQTMLNEQLAMGNGQNNYENNSYVPSPMFRQLLEHGSLSSAASRAGAFAKSPSNGLFSQPVNDSSINNYNNNNSSSKQQRIAIINSFLSKSNVIGGNGVISQPPSFWVYEKSTSAAGSLRSLRRRLHSISFVSSSSSRSSNSNKNGLNGIGSSDDEGDDNNEMQRMMSPREYSSYGKKKSALVLKFSVSETVSSQQHAANGNNNSSSAAMNDVIGTNSKNKTTTTSNVVDIGLPADGAGPGVLAIPILSVTMVEVTVVSPFTSSENRSYNSAFNNNVGDSSSPLLSSSSILSTKNSNLAHGFNNSNTAQDSREILEAFSYICGVGIPILVFRIEHRGELGDWSPSRQINRDKQVTNPQNENNNPSSGKTWTRQRALEKAASIPSCSAKGAAMTAFTFYLPLTKTTAPNVLHYVEYLRKMLDSAVAIDEEAKRVLIESATELMKNVGEGGNFGTKRGGNNGNEGSSLARRKSFRDDEFQIL